MLWSVVAVAEPNPERNAYFGEEHIHTSWSVDAWVMGYRFTGPGEALKYAQGESIKRPMGFDMHAEDVLAQYDALRACRVIDERLESLAAAEDALNV